MALTFDDDQAAKILDALGLPADTTDTDRVHAVIIDAGTASTAEGAQPSAVAAAARRSGLAVTDPDTLATLRRDAAEGRKMVAAAAAQKVEASVDDAISKGKITVSRRSHWISAITNDPGMAEILASYPNEMAVPLSEIGHGSSDDGGADDKVGWFY